MKKLTFLFLLFISIESYSCSCARIKGSLKQQVKWSYSKNDLIFAGKFISIEQIPKQNKKVFIGGYLKVTLEVKEVFKGKLSTKKIDVYTSSSGASCGYNFIRGESYLVYNQQYENKFHTGLCSRTQNLNSLKKREKKILRRLRKA